MEDYDVGGDMEWKRPSDPKFYITWATGKTFRVGDELEFDFAAGMHDVAVVTKDAFDNCKKENPISHMTTPPVKIMLNTTGPQYYICTVGDHCRVGQKLSINVVGAGGAGGGATPGA
nr:Chain A, Umecyanin [Armoracia rusticana]1X9R_B Chain B, Umecyanin [Armoracia rusticana]1X9U_A Chain A, Umecyanin [Armoracia rusticana]1X9U_B Chain B, Umecyanin [Armoracia rusticana]